MLTIILPLLQASTSPSTICGLACEWNQVFPPGNILGELVIAGILLVLGLYALQEFMRTGQFQKWRASTYGTKKNIADDAIEPLNLPANSTFNYVGGVHKGRIFVIKRAWYSGYESDGTWEGGFEFEGGRHETGVKSYQLNIPVSLELVKGNVIPFDYDPDGFGDKSSITIASLIERNARLNLQKNGMKSDLFKQSLAHNEVNRQQKENEGAMWREKTPTGRRPFLSQKNDKGKDDETTGKAYSTAADDLSGE